MRLRLTICRVISGSNELLTAPKYGCQELDTSVSERRGTT
uniref:Uncharacterized protein n=1 Tax=Nonomuraea gerenzanensis TaxID=93944 RepID=A0A1M4EB39_9ACTN|nr:hypothetical protein BN4615_P5526 [Nonomuraea gerenzanensis]